MTLLWHGFLFKETKPAVYGTEFYLKFPTHREPPKRPDLPNWAL